MTQRSARIAIAERWSVLRRGLLGLFHGTHAVVADVTEFKDLRRLVEQRPLDLVIVGDDPMSDLIADVSDLHAIAPDLPIIVLCDEIDAERLRAVLRCGARGVFSKKVADDVLLDGVARALDGDRVVDQRFLPLLFGGEHLAPASGAQADSLLTRRELDVLAQLARGSTNREIADALVLGESTVKTHLARIYAKLGVDDRHHAVGRALELGLLS